MYSFTCLILVYINPKKYAPTYVFTCTFTKNKSLYHLVLTYIPKTYFSFGRLICMPKMAKPKTPEMSSPLREEESEYRNGLTHKLNFRSGDCILTFRFYITHLLIALFISLSNRHHRCYCGCLSYQKNTNLGCVSVTRWQKYV